MAAFGPGFRLCLGLDVHGVYSCCDADHGFGRVSDPFGSAHDSSQFVDSYTSDTLIADWSINPFTGGQDQDLGPFVAEVQGSELGGVDDLFTPSEVQGLELGGVDNPFTVDPSDIPGGGGELPLNPDGTTLIPAVAVNERSLAEVQGAELGGVDEDLSDIPSGGELPIRPAPPSIGPPRPPIAPPLPPNVGPPQEPPALPSEAPQLPPEAPPTAPQGPAPAVPDEWVFTTTEHSPIPMVQSFDTGNRVGNFVLEALLPWRNLLAAIENKPFEIIGALDDALKHSAFAKEYEAAQVMLPLEGALGLTMEVGPALEYAVTSIFTNQRLQALVRAPLWWFMGAGGVGGGNLPAESIALGEQAAGLGSPTLNPRLIQRLARWRAYRMRGGQLDLSRWVGATQGAPWGTGFPSEYAPFESSLLPKESTILMNRARGVTFQNLGHQILGIPENTELVFGRIGEDFYYIRGRTS
ncbi:MAG TPA: hypothetical protein VNZ53_17830 [Steroidobacteraceae bacterium]|nr:hypothetical protein [Steroidobacteraceae bacterium]